MLFRKFLIFAFVAGAAIQAQAATVKSFVVQCVDRQEVTNDDIFLVGVADGKAVPWGKDDQKGTSTGNALSMKEGDSLSLNAQALAGLNFTGSVQIHIQEKDVTGDETFGVVNLTPDDGTKSLVFKGKDWEYHVTYTVEK